MTVTPSFTFACARPGTGSAGPPAARAVGAGPDTAVRPMTCLPSCPPGGELPRQVEIRAYEDSRGEQRGDTRHAYPAAQLADIKDTVTIHPVCHEPDEDGEDPVPHYGDRINAVPHPNLDYKGCEPCRARLATADHDVIVGDLVLRYVAGEIARSTGRLPVPAPPPARQPARPAPREPLARRLAAALLGPPAPPRRSPGPSGAPAASGAQHPAPAGTYPPGRHERPFPVREREIPTGRTR
uniref:hypothetical protein n=1 Tax=Amycolatopsis sp. CA-096443 TaxID=3239919 RepID=UPI003F494FAF